MGVCRMRPPIPPSLAPQGPEPRQPHPPPLASISGSSNIAAP